MEGIKKGVRQVYQATVGVRVSRNFNSRLHRLERQRRQSQCHWVDSVELYPDGREVFLYKSFVSADINQIVIVVPKESEETK